jgi:hypothetical protein
MLNRQQRIIELEALAAEEGIRLPWPADVIAGVEEKGHLVDLVTGALVLGGSAQRVSLTVVGEAVAVANAAGASLL